jgi:hypothetical protein
MYQVWIRKTNTSELLNTCRNTLDGIKTGEVMLPQDNLGGDLLIGQGVPGMQTAPVGSGLSR